MLIFGDVLDELNGDDILDAVSSLSVYFAATGGVAFVGGFFMVKNYEGGRGQGCLHQDETWVMIPFVARIGDGAGRGLTQMEAFFGTGLYLNCKYVNVFLNRLRLPHPNTAHVCTER